MLKYRQLVTEMEIDLKISLHDADTALPVGNYHMLDAIRGIAATIVMTRHLPDIYGQFTFPRCYLAVDLFFVLSGFVIANAYGNRLAQGMGMVEFMRVRLIRFFPFYLLAFALAIVDVALEINLGGGRDWTDLSLSVAIIAGLFFLPAPGAPQNALYPLNNPSWSLGFEIVINRVYAVIHRWLTLKVLCGILILSALGMIRYSLYFNTVNFGDTWDTIPAALARVSFSFFAGVLVWRLRGDRRVSNLACLGLAVIIAALLMAPIGAMPFDLIAVMLLFPALVWLAARVEPGPRMAPMAIKLGLASYGVYVIHTPIGRIIEQLAKANGYAISKPWVGIIFILAVTALVLWLDRHFDQPLRKALLRITKSKPKDAPASGMA